MQTVTIRSTILPELIRKTLVRGTILSAIGALSLLAGGIFIPVHEMKGWGFLLFAFSIGLITAGLLPYKRLKRLEERPNTLMVEEEWLRFSAKGKLLFSIPLGSVDHISYVDANPYGIAVILKKPLPQKIVVHNPKLSKPFLKQSCDIFLPYFSKRSFETLQELL